jgi:cytoskeletal protein RodZ
MTSDTAGTGFGRYLQSIRLQRGITLEKVSEETRIGLGMLKSIEQEALDELPAEVFLKGFLRSYSNFIGADGNEVIRRYETQRDVNQKITNIEQMPQRLSTGSFWKFVLALLVLALLMFASIFGIHLLEQSDHSAETSQAALLAMTKSKAGLRL